MKSLYIFLFALAICIESVSGQDRVTPNKPYSSLYSGPGYITNNEFTSGFGLGNVSLPFNKTFLGFNTIHGYQVNRYSVFSGGTGVLLYNGGTLIPVFFDIRIRLRIRLFTPYIYGDGGFLLNPKGGSKMYLNPGAGVRYALSNQLGLTLGAGLWVQMGETRDSFVNVKLGVVFMPK